MISNIRKLSVLLALSAVSLFAVTNSARAVILGPYTPNANTMHLWHLDTPAISTGTTAPTSPDAVGNSLPLTKSQEGSVGIAAGAFGYAGDQSFRAFYTGGLDHPSMVTFTNAATLLGGAGTGAWTIEGLVNLEQLGSGVLVRSNNNEIRAYLNNPGGGGQTLLVDVGFDGALTPNREFPIPAQEAVVGNGNPQFVQTNRWYHWAIQYNGNDNTANNVQAFWTPLDNSYTSAQSLGFRSSAVDPVIDRFVLDSQSGGNILGRMDEVRISDTLLPAAGGMMFGTEAPPTNPVPEPSTYALGLIGLAGLGLFAWRRRRRS